MLGQLKLPLTARTHFTVTGGPSHEAPFSPDHLFVKMAQEIPMACDINIPTRDFSVPDKEVLARGLEKAVEAILKGTPVYVGCMAGRGRTGLFLAVLARAFGVKNPVEYVRETYYKHAVETPDQYAYVMDFVITPALQRRIDTARFWQRLRFWQSGNLTNQSN